MAGPRRGFLPSPFTRLFRLRRPVRRRPLARQRQGISPHAVATYNAAPRVRTYDFVGDIGSCPLRVYSGHPALKLRCPLYPSKLPRLSPTGVSALGQKATLRWVFDMIESVGKVLKLVEHHHETSPSPILASRSRRCRAVDRLAHHMGASLSVAAGKPCCRLCPRAGV